MLYSIFIHQHPGKLVAHIDATNAGKPSDPSHRELTRVTVQIPHPNYVMESKGEFLVALSKISYSLRTDLPNWEWRTVIR